MLRSETIIMSFSVETLGESPYDIWQDASTMLLNKQNKKREGGSKHNKQKEQSMLYQRVHWKRCKVTWPTGCRYTAGIWDEGWENRHWERPSGET